MRILLTALFSACLWMTAAPALAELITVAYSAEAVTVASKPFGMTIPRLTVVNGYFTFDTSTPDSDANTLNGAYQHTGNAGFLAEFLDTSITGSHTAFYQVQLSGSSDSDTFRCFDGPTAVGPEGGVMSIDGVPDETIQLFLAITDDAFDDDDLADPFPFYTFGFLGTSHTFSLKDPEGTMLLQFLSAAAVECGDPTGTSGITSNDALQVLRASVGSRSCLPCVCDVDHTGSVSVTDALKVLRHAVGSGQVLDCAQCL